MTSSSLGYSVATERPWVGSLSTKEFPSISVRRDELSTNLAPPKKIVSRKRNPRSYDLGIGKNPAVNGVTSFVNEADPAKYWAGHEATNAFPSPIRKKPLPKVHLKRMAQDVLEIKERGERGDPHSPYVVKAFHREQLDLNTLWVETLIHAERQRQLATVAPN